MTSLLRRARVRAFECFGFGTGFTCVFSPCRGAPVSIRMSSGDTGGHDASRVARTFEDRAPIG